MRNMTSRLKSLGTSSGFTEADKEILVKIVKHAQWLGISGAKGPWAKFLATIDRCLPECHDPSKRPWNVLASFLETWREEKDLEIIKRVREYLNFRKTADMLEATEEWPDYPEEKLARRTRQHPLFSRDYNFPSYHEDWVRSELVRAKDLSPTPNLLALDCEMALCEDGTMQVVRVCLVDRNLQTVIDTLVRPSKTVKEYKSHITGVTAEDLESVTVTQTDIQTKVKGTLSPGTIVIGHSLFNDLRALHIDHRRVIDTAYLFPIRNRPQVWSPALRDLCKLVLGYDFRDDAKPHDCLEDAKIPMKIALHCIKEGLKPLTIPDEIDEAVLSKLLIHKVPKGIRLEELKYLFPRGTSFEFQEVDKETNSDSKYFSTYAVFSSKEVANNAFNQLRSPATEDITGRLQKIVFVRSRFQHKNASRISVVVRKMNISSRCLEVPRDTPGENPHSIVESKCSGVETAEGSLLAMETKISGLETGTESISVTSKEVVGSKRSRTEDEVEEQPDILHVQGLKKKKKKSVASSVEFRSVEGEKSRVKLARESKTVSQKSSKKKNTKKRKRSNAKKK
ncbi:hypothetical protein R1sor_002647 [Riccia sorocarpa]|uniref:Exonuclease domain-containing protein n=1 Tax=Riccia sorocarpa TaxID=122646 RepID=A0ABD3H2T9_9MARC